jgi:hypothetical protein
MPHATYFLIAASAPKHIGVASALAGVVAAVKTLTMIRDQAKDYATKCLLDRDRRRVRRGSADRERYRNRISGRRRGWDLEVHLVQTYEAGGQS